MTKDSMSITTDNAAGYSLYISMIGEDTSLVSEHGNTIDPTSATTDSPAPLPLDKWGFAVPSQNTFTTIKSFSSEYQSLENLDTGESAGVWAAVPGKDDMVMIQKTEAGGTFDLDVYYGFNISTNIMAGLYSGRVLYTVIANTIDFRFDDFVISPTSTDNLLGGDIVTLTTSVEPAVDWEDLGEVRVTIGEGECDNASGTIIDGEVSISCDAPILPIGVYDVEINLVGLDGSTHIIEKGYAVELSRRTDNIIVTPNEIEVDSAETLHIATGITTLGLTTDDLIIIIGENDCSIISASYNQNGTLDIECTSPEIADAGIIDLSLLIPKYEQAFNTSLAVGVITLSEVTYMQEMTPTICDNTATPSLEAREIITGFYSGADMVPTNYLIDQRDGKEYAVSKLADGNCWMTQNLRLGGDETIILSTNDSDVRTNYSLPLTQQSGKNGWNNVEAHLYDTGNLEAGYIYNWIAATGGEGVDGELSGDVDSSICPKGWTLPSVANDPGYLGMLNAYGWNNNSQAVDSLIGSPFDFVFSGGYYYGYGGTANGEYWTSSPDLENANKSYYLKLESLSRRVFTTTTKPRSGGTAVRCVARKE